MNWSDSPFSVPIAFFIAWLGVVIVKTVSAYKVRKLRSQERLAAIEKGLPLPPDEPTAEEKEMASGLGGSPRTPNPARRIGYLRTGGIICISTGVGIMLFFMALTHIVQNRMVLCGAAVGLIPLAIGVGLLIDMSIQRKDQPPAPPPAAPEPPAPPTQY